MTHHDAGVELVEALHGAIAEAVAQVFLDKVWVVEDVVGHQGLLPLTDIVGKKELTRKKTNKHSETDAQPVDVCRQAETRKYLAFNLVCDVLLLCRGVTLRVNESGMGHQVASVLHDEAPAKNENYFSAAS